MSMFWFFLGKGEKRGIGLTEKSVLELRAAFSVLRCGSPFVRPGDALDCTFVDHGLDRKNVSGRHGT